MQKLFFQAVNLLSASYCRTDPTGNILLSKSARQCYRPDNKHILAGYHPHQHSTWLC